MQELISLFGGAFLGYLFARLQRRDENRSRRELLLEVLRNELQYLDPHLGPFRVGLAFHRDELVLLAPARLLDVLDYGGDGSLIRALLAFQVAVAKHNGLVRTLSFVRGLGVAGECERRRIEEELARQHGAILAAAERVRRCVEARPGRRAGPLRHFRRRGVAAAPGVAG